MRRIGVHHANPFEFFYLAKGADQGRQSIDLTEVFAVSRRILGDQDDLFYSLFRELTGLFDDRSETARPEAATHRRDRAERARAVAALGYLNEGRMAFRR